MTTGTKQLPFAQLLRHAARGRRLMCEKGTSLNGAVSHASRGLPDQARAAIQWLLYESVRRSALTCAVLERLTQRRPKEPAGTLIELALTALIAKGWPAFTVVNEAVTAVRSERSCERLSGLTNAVLRRFLADGDALLEELRHRADVRFNAPDWWIERLRKSYGVETEAILEAGLRHPPLTIRVNTRRTTPDSYIKILEESGLRARTLGREALLMETPCPIEALPGFADGLVSVQDAGTQLAAHFLPIPQEGRVLDACAAPGGKTAHILEQKDCRLTALEIDPVRALKIEETLVRLGLSAEAVHAVNALDLDRWWDGEPFDAILLDAPCTASGVVRRQPDVPWSRRPEDIRSLARTQAKLLRKLWHTLTPGGHLLFCTCSIFPEEGIRQVETFLNDTPDAQLKPLAEGLAGMMTLLPTDSEHPETTPGLPEVHDGFFYALFAKAS